MFCIISLIPAAVSAFTRTIDSSSTSVHHAVLLACATGGNRACDALAGECDCVSEKLYDVRGDSPSASAAPRALARPALHVRFQKLNYRLD